MINYDINSLSQECKIFLCEPNNEAICELNGIESSAALFNIELNNQDEIEFDYNRYINIDGKLVESNGYNQLVTGMRLFIENFGFFILKQPSYIYDGEKETKHIIAYSAESGLENKDLISFKINTGEEDSYEYLVEYEHSPYYTQEEINTMPSGTLIMNGDASERPDYESFYNFLLTEFPSGVAKTIMRGNPLFYIGNDDDGYINLRYISEEEKSIVIGETEDLINPYGEELYDYIVFYNTFAEQLVEFKKKYSSFIIVNELPTENIDTDSCYLILTETSNVYYRYYYDDNDWVELPEITLIIDTSGEETQTTVIVDDSDDIIEVDNFCKLIPRLKKKVNRDYVSNQIESITEYIKYYYSDGEITEIHLDNIGIRIDELIVFYTKYKDQLSLLNLALSNSEADFEWKVGDIDKSIANLKLQFDIDGQNIYSFLTQDIASQSKCIAQFDYLNYIINYVAIDNLGEDSKTIIDKKNYINSVDISVKEDKLITRYNVSGGNDLDIKDVNFGTNQIVNIDYYLNAKDENNNRIYVPDSLASKYELYKSDVEKARIVYIEKTKQLRQLQKDIDELTFRVPNDEIKNDWGTFTQDELNGALINYEDLLNSLKSMYREEFTNGVDSNDKIYDYYVGLQLPISKNGEENVDYYIVENNGYNHYIFSNGTYSLYDTSPPPPNTVTIRNTYYWHDYFAYKEAITQINFALLAIINNTTYKEVTPETVMTEDGTPGGTRVDVPKLLKEISAWETDWLLYGIKELQAKVNVYNNTMDTLTEKDSVLLKADGTSKAWNELDETTEQINYKSSSSYNDAKEQYDLAKEERDSCQSYLNNLKAEVLDKELECKNLSEILKQIKINVNVYNYSRKTLRKYVPSIPNKNNVFDTSEKTIIYTLYSDNNYSNDNILKTSIDDIVSVIDIEKELLDDAIEKLSIVSQPQYTFNTNIDNIMALKCFEGYNFKVGNFVYLECYDDYYVKLRLNSIQFNPFAPEESLSITFTNYTKSNSERSDLSFILKDSTSSGSGGSSGGSSRGSGEFGNSNKIDITISNTMLSKLLNTEMFASRVSDAILDSLKVNNLNVQYATFGSLAGGQTIIDGSCIQTGSIKSYNYDDGTEQGHTAAGSILNLNDGTFSFAGGKLTYNNNTLNVTGTINAQSGDIGNFTIDNGSLISSRIKLWNANSDSTDYQGIIELDSIYNTSRTLIYHHSISIKGVGEYSNESAVMGLSSDSPFLVFTGFNPSIHLVEEFGDNEARLKPGYLKLINNYSKFEITGGNVIIDNRQTKNEEYYDASSTHSSYIKCQSFGRTTGGMHYDAKVEVENDVQKGSLLASTTGNFGIYSTTFSKYLIKCDSSGAVICADGSDKRIKDSIVPMPIDEMYHILKETEIVNHTYISDKRKTIYNGIIAQNLRDVLINNNIGYRPYLLIESELEYDKQYFDLTVDETKVKYSIDYRRFTPILWKGWQYHDEEIEQLKKELLKIKLEIKELKGE